MKKQQFIAVQIFFIFIFRMIFFSLDCHLLFKQQFDKIKIKSLTYVFLFKKFVDCDFNNKYQKLYK